MQLKIMRENQKLLGWVRPLTVISKPLILPETVPNRRWVIGAHQLLEGSHFCLITTMAARFLTADKILCCLGELAKTLHKDKPVQVLEV